jgi:hypothetical protein
VIPVAGPILVRVNLIDLLFEEDQNILEGTVPDIDF